MNDTPMQTTSATRRQFLQASAASAAAASLPIARAAYAAGEETTLRVGLIGCGGRGTGAAGQALRADKYNKLVAMGDAFEDRLNNSLSSLKTRKDIADKIDVPPEHRFVGFDAYKKVTDMCDVVLLTTPPGFRPQHIRYAVEQGKHVFAEKPVAVDPAGVRSVLETCELAKRKKLSVVSGLCLRYYYAFQETMKQIHGGAIGDLVALQADDYRGQIWHHDREKVAARLGHVPTEMEYQMANWYHYTWLCGDFNVEQHVHMLDVCAWALGDEYPSRVVCMGGRDVRPEPGQIFDHFGAVYDYASGAKLYANCRQIRGRKVHRNIGAEVLGTKGRGVISENEKKNELTIGGKPWRFSGEQNDFYQTEHDVLFASIRGGEPVNNGDYMCKSTMMAVMARMSAYTGEAVTWEEAMKSPLDLSPSGYAWDAQPPSSAVALPGTEG